jgi:hypothetical protein
VEVHQAVWGHQFQRQALDLEVVLGEEGVLGQQQVEVAWAHGEKLAQQRLGQQVVLERGKEVLDQQQGAWAGVKLALRAGPSAVLRVVALWVA